MVEIHDLRTWAIGQLGFDPMRPIAAQTWLNASEQQLLECIAGEVFHDADGRLTRLRKRLAYFPSDVRLAKLAQTWQAISDEEAFVGRTGMRGDETGSRLIAARQAERLVTIAFLLERRYRPYSKWLGTASSRLKIAPRLRPHLEAALNTGEWRERERRLALAAKLLAESQNRLRLAPPQPTALRTFHGRGFVVLDAQRFAAAVRAQIRSSTLRRIAGSRPPRP